MGKPQAKKSGSSGLVVAVVAVAVFVSFVRSIINDATAPATLAETEVADPNPALYQSEVEEGLGAAVAIVVDTSGSMGASVPGSSLPKQDVAKAALEKLLDVSDAFVKKRPDFPIKVAVFAFASEPWKLLEIGPYDRERTQAALRSVPDAGGGTAIGEALAMARAELYRSGVFRKYIVVVTDGDNTVGVGPEQVARTIYKKSEGSVPIYFVAFDTSAEKFGFLKEVGGDVIQANNAVELETALTQIYEGKILAESVDYGETEHPRDVNADEAKERP